MYQDPEMRAAAQNHHEPTTVPVKVVGMKFRVGEGVKIDRGTKVWVKPEPENEHDPDAMAVMAEGHGMIGYISRKDQHKELLKATCRISGRAHSGYLQQSWNKKFGDNLITAHISI